MALAALQVVPTQSSDELLDPPIPFGRYQLIRRLGHGGFAAVYLALEASASGKPRAVVVKRLHEHLSLDARSREAFLDEARLVLGLNHPNIVTALDFGSIEGRPFLAMEYLVGADLDRVVERLRTQNERLKPELVMQIGSDVLEGLAYLHERRDASGRPAPIVHRDISPHNVFVTEAGTVKLLDFGIAKARARAIETTTGVVKGKFAYMSPEQAHGEPVEPAADVWSAGVLLWEMFAGQRLFEASSAFSTLASSMTAPIPRLDTVADVPERLASVIEKALSRAPEQRFQNARELLIALREASPYPEGDRGQVAALVQGLFGDVLTRAREESERRLIQNAPSREERSARLLWAISGSALALSVSAALVAIYLPSKQVPPETNANGARPAQRENMASAEAPMEKAPAPPVPKEAPAPDEKPGQTAPSEGSLPEERSAPPRAAKKERARDEVRTGYLSLVSEPWSEVSLGTKHLGTTPLVRLELPVGRHTLTLRNPPSGRETKLVIDIKPGETLQRRVTLGVAPAKP